jgi:predicted MPP superfamily phosphohydrolase
VYVFIRGLQAVDHFPPVIKWVYCILFWSCALSITLVFTLRNAKIAVNWLHILSSVGTGWLIFTLYMVLMLLCFDLLRVFSIFVPYSFFICLLLTICISGYGYYRYQHPDTQVIDIAIDKPSANGVYSLKVVAFSDVHLGTGTTEKQLRKYVQMINAQQPDVIIISGDLIDNSISSVRNQHMEESLSTLQAPSGIYMVPGNHEYISGIDDCIEFISTETPVCLLRDSVVTLPCGIQLAGRDDRSNHKRKKTSELLAQTNPDDPIILLDHQPYELSSSVEAGVDLLFCGHTHNGQVWPVNHLTKWLFEVSYGYVKRNRTNIYVSSGLSLWGPPFRIGTSSEMVVFNISLKH